MVGGMTRQIIRRTASLTVLRTIPLLIVAAAIHVFGIQADVVPHEAPAVTATDRAEVALRDDIDTGTCWTTGTGHPIPTRAWFYDQAGVLRQGPSGPWLHHTGTGRLAAYCR